jgi:membrane dipeptidase
VCDVAVREDHIRDVAGIEALGIKGTFDVRRCARRAGGRVAVPALFEKLTDRGSTDEDLGKITGGRVLQVMREAERLRERRSSQAS